MHLYDIKLLKECARKCASDIIIKRRTLNYDGIKLRNKNDFTYLAIFIARWHFGETLEETHVNLLIPPVCV